MDIWKKLSRDGDRLFNSLAYELANEKYLRALERSRFLYEHCSNKIEAIDCIVSSHLKLCECLLQNYEFEFAGNVVLHAHRVLLTMITNKQNSANEYFHLLKARREVSQTILQLLSQYPEVQICDTCYIEIFGHSREYQQSNAVN